MKKSYRIIFLSIVAGEIAAILFIGANIYKNKIHAAASVYSIRKKDITIAPDGELHNFFELAPSHTMQGKPDWLPYQTIQTINADGLNERFDYAVPKPAHTFRIVSLGDSYTYGIYVNTAENYSELLEDMLNRRLGCDAIKKFEVINLGVPGYDARYSAERFMRRGIKYSPDLVIWIIKNEDLFQITDVLYGTLSENTREGMSSEDSARFFEEKRQEMLRDMSEDDRYAYQEAALRHFADIWKGELLIFSAPNYLSPREKKILFDLEKLSPHIHVAELLPESIRALPYIIRKGDDHFSTQGHTLTAEILFAYLKENFTHSCAAR